MESEVKPLTQWKPKLDVEKRCRNSFGKVLFTAKSEFRRRFEKTDVDYFKPIRDPNGLVGYSHPKVTLVARGYIYGNIISVNKSILISTAEQNKPVVVYIRDADKFYMFDPRQLLREGDENTRAGVRMVNFPILLGINPEK